jgi:hypothetical protein
MDEVPVMILVWGVMDDTPTRMVCSTLADQGIPYLLIDQHRILDVEFDFDAHQAGVGRLHCQGDIYSLSDIGGAYFRSFDWQTLLAGDRDKKKREKFSRVQADLMAWGEVSPGAVINRVSAMASNSSKPYQSIMIKKAGFDIPDTIITTDPDEVLTFQSKYKQIIYKSISGIRSIVSCFSEKQADYLENVKNCPTQFQEYVTGTDIRVHVVGTEIFASKIDTPAIDYRYASRSNQDLDIQPWRIPDDIAQACIDLTRSLGLSFSGVDLRLTPSGQWYCFEVNPSPAYTFYESWTGQDITQSVIRLLTSSYKTSHR